jgi:hypothetical protein
LGSRSPSESALVLALVMALVMALGLALGLLLLSALVLAMELNGPSVWVWVASLRPELVWWRVSASG